MAYVTVFNDIIFIEHDVNNPFQFEFSIDYLNSYESYADIKIEDNKINIYEYDEIIDTYEL